MTVPDSCLEALRAFLREDSDGWERAMARMRVDGTFERYPRVQAAAMVVLVERRLGSTPTLADIVSLVARLRASHRINDELDVDPSTAELMIRAGYGDADAIQAIAERDQHVLAEVQAFLITTLAEDEALDPSGMDALIAQIRERAEASPESPR